MVKFQKYLHLQNIVDPILCLSYFHFAFGKVLLQPGYNILLVRNNFLNFFNLGILLSQSCLVESISQKKGEKKKEGEPNSKWVMSKFAITKIERKRKNK